MGPSTCSTPCQFGQVPVLKVLYLFAGKRRQADVGSTLREASVQFGFTLQLEELDIERSPEHDLTDQALWDRIFEIIRDGGWCVLVSPPCNTFSRARFQFERFPGPRPLRSREYPKGFPWLSGANEKLVLEANKFVENCIQCCRLAASHGGFFLLEHPEDLGLTNDQMLGSIWQWDEVQDLVPSCSGVTFAIQQCHFGARTPKPTRFLCNFPVNDKRCWKSWPRFGPAGNYLGPLPKKCGHKHTHKLIGKTANKWNTSPSAAYPPGLCKFLAELFISATAASGGGKTHSRGKRSLPERVDRPIEDTAEDTVEVHSVSSEAEQDKFGDATLEQTKEVHQPAAEGDFEVVKCGNSGRPLEVEWDGKRRCYNDGFGLCSPTRWEPSSRGTRRSRLMLDLGEKTFQILSKVVHECIQDVRLEAFKLVTGKLTQSPFPKDVLDRLRNDWAHLLRNPKDAVLVDEGQPFLLRGLAQWLEVFEDPDVGWLVDAQDSFSSGVYVGVDKPLPRSPQVFPVKTQHRKLDDTEFAPFANNYASAQISAVELERKFREEEALGRMVPTKEAVARAEFGDSLRIASMAAIVKPDGSIRPLHDGTHSVMVNHAIEYQDQLQLPGPAEVASVVREASETLEAPFCVSADIKAAHRLVKIRKADWGLLGCKADSSSDIVWLNKCGTFGISSAPYWWAKLFGLIGRFVGHVMGMRWFLHLTFVDDLHGVFVGRDKFVHLWVWLLAFELIGAPFGYHKFRGGLETEFVGYTLKYDVKSVGISSRRGDWLRSWYKDVRDKKFTVSTRSFQEFLGRLSFVAQVLVWLKPHLAPLFAWGAATSSSTVAKLPETVVLTLQFIDLQLLGESYLVSIERPLVLPGEQFRTDAKCTDDQVVLGGWELSSGRWFSLALTRAEVPYLFRNGKGSQWASTSAELLAVIVALHVFGWLNPELRRKLFPLVLVGGTDNRSNEYLSLKRSTTRWPLMLLNMQLSLSMSRARLQLNLKWRPREENVWADELTNSDFNNFDLALRIPVKFSDIDLSLVDQLWGSKQSFDLAREQAKLSGPSSPSKKKKYDKTPW